MLRDVLRDPSIWDAAWDSYKFSRTADGEGLDTPRYGPGRTDMQYQDTYMCTHEAASRQRTHAFQHGVIHSNAAQPVRFDQKRDLTSNEDHSRKRCRLAAGPRGSAACS